MVVVQAVWCHHWMPLMLMSERSGREIEGWMVGRGRGAGWLSLLLDGTAIPPQCNPPSVQSSLLRSPQCNAS